MEKYENISVVGEGSYGLVMKCRHKESGQFVAIKKFIETEEDLTVRKMALREIRMLKKLRHENLVNMIEVFRRKKRFYLVFEYLDHTILDELENVDRGLDEDVCRQHIFQVIRGIDFCHQNQIIHRDVKPENVLVSSLGVIKLCDFGFARLMSINGETYTDYVATRWYRAPELLVGDTKYGTEVDIWAIGCLFTEMMTGDPLFPGDSDIDQLFQIMKIMGKLSPKHQMIILRNPMFKGLKKNNEDSGKPLHDLFPTWSSIAIDFVASCLRMDPSARPTSGELLRHKLMTHDNFAERFLPELRQKILQEFRCNPLLRKCQPIVLGGSAPRRGRDQTQTPLVMEERVSTRRGSFVEAPRWKMNFLSDSVARSNETSKVNKRKTEQCLDMGEDEAENRGYSLVAGGEQQSQIYGVKYTAEAAESDILSPAPFQSLQSFNIQGITMPTYGQPIAEFPSTPARKESNFVSRTLQNSFNPNQVPLAPRTQFIRRLDRPALGLLLDNSPLNTLGESTTPPPWLASRRGELATPQPWGQNRRGELTTPQPLVTGKNHQSRNDQGNSWRYARSSTNDDFSLPNVPGATASPKKGNKKKLNPITPVQIPTEMYISPRHGTSRPPSDSSRFRNNHNFPFM